ncbi:MAG: hypothetical protein SWJ54_05625 [Cyanobacteriota bacterium]|nr:hypothetical protein [Cyanobacteriota bacterium]
MFGSKKITQPVTFTIEDAADQILWEAIEKELSLTKYQTFSNLCKQALWQFLFVSESSASTPTNSVSSTPTVSVSSQKLEEQITQVQRQLSHLEDKVLTEEGDHFERLQRQLIQMTQQLAQLQVATTQKPTVPVSQPVAQTPQVSSPSVIQAPQPQPTSQPTVQASQPSSPQPVAAEFVPAEKQTPVTPKQESDPVLQRLSSLVDDF